MFYILSLVLLLCQEEAYSQIGRFKDMGKIVVYGEDERYDINRFPGKVTLNKQSKVLEWSKSILAMVHRQDMQKGPYDLFVTLQGPTLQEQMQLCPKERFADQMSVAECTGFLVAEDLVLTAGHCVAKPDDCKNYAWVFGFNAEQITSSASKTPFIWKKDVYYCEKIVTQNYDPKSKGLDYALIRLHRKVVDRKPLELRRKGKIDSKAKLLTLGHPSGLPLKVADNGIVKNNKAKEFFSLKIDTFHGNSGSPVMNVETGLVEGILVRGDKDYEFDEEKNCNRAKVCSSGECIGEDVVRSRYLLDKLDL